MAEKYGVNRFVKTEHKITHCQWDEQKKKWKIAGIGTKTRETFEDDADILISARGNLNDYAWPSIPGLDSFKGEVMHSAVWNQQ